MSGQHRPAPLAGRSTHAGENTGQNRGSSCAKGRAHLQMRTYQESNTCSGLRTPMVVRPCRMSPDCASPGARGPEQRAPRAVDAKGSATMTTYPQDSTHPSACDAQGSAPWCARSQGCLCPGLRTPRASHVLRALRSCASRMKVSCNAPKNL